MDDMFFEVHNGEIVVFTEKDKAVPVTNKLLVAVSDFFEAHCQSSGINRATVEFKDGTLTYELNEGGEGYGGNK